MHRKLVFLLAATVLICVSVSVAAAENSEPQLLSGYVLDSDGHGIAGATVKLIYGSPYYPQNVTDATGFFEFQGWANVPVKLCIYPPKGSGFVDYTNESFTIQPGMTANFTLTRGYTLSGRILDQNGNPVTGEVFLDSHWSGQWSNSSTGSFWVSAPAGTYTVRVLGGASRWGSASFEYEALNKTITLNNDVTGSIIVTSLEPTFTTTEPTPNAPNATETTEPTSTTTQTTEPTPTIPEIPTEIVFTLAVASAAVLICVRKIRSRSGLQKVKTRGVHSKSAK